MTYPAALIVLVLLVAIMYGEALTDLLRPPCALCKRRHRGGIRR